MLIRITLIVPLGMIITFLFQDLFIQFLLYPLRQAEPQAQLALLSPIEGFMASLKLSFWAGLIGTLPFWIYPIIKFIIPGLHTQERQMILPFMIGSFFSLCLGMIVAYSLTLPMAIAYFYQYNSAIGLNLWSLSAYLDFTLLLLFGHAVVFECALALLFLVHYGFVGAEGMRSKRRIAIIAAFVIGALVTPPDVPSQLMVALPLIGIYELGIIYARYCKKNAVRQL